jgi:glycerophosphoryl diester phosphodiesterase
MKIIGHRGAAGLELENTLPSFRLALEIGVNAVELDIQLTSDRQPVVCHDDNLKRVGGGDHSIKELTYDQLSKLTLSNGTNVPHLREVLEITGKTTVIIEVKVEGGVQEVLGVLEEFPDANPIIASPLYSEIAVLKELRPHIRGYIRVLLNPFEAIQSAKAYQADGLDMNFWILNPLTYFLARYSKLDIMVYTVNSRLIARFIQVLYPKVAICTNHPDWFIKHRWAKIKAGKAAIKRRVANHRHKSA